MLRSTLSPSHKKVKTAHTLPEPSFLSVLIPWYFLITLPTERPAHCHQYQPQDYYCCMIIFSLHNPSILPPDHHLSTQPKHTATRSSSLYTTPAYCHQIIFFLDTPITLPPDHLLSRLHYHNILLICKRVLGHMVCRDGSNFTNYNVTLFEATYIGYMSMCV